MRATYTLGVATLIVLAACGGDTGSEADQRDGYTNVYGTFVEEGFQLLLGVCEGDEVSDDIFVFMADEDDDDRAIRALRAICPEYVEQTLDG